MKILFDIESTGLLRQGSQIHCIVCKDVDTDELYVFDTVKDNIDEGVQFLLNADELIGHNIAGYDIPLLKELYPDFKPKKVTDTLILSRMLHSTLSQRDYQYKPKGLPAKLYGRHSLEAWGIRLREYKGAFGKENDWKTYSQEMLEYCIQDVTVNVKLYRKFMKEVAANA